MAGKTDLQKVGEHSVAHFFIQDERRGNEEQGDEQAMESDLLLDSADEVRPSDVVLRENFSIVTY